MIVEALVQAVVSGIVGGVITGVAAFAAIKIELRWLRRDVDRMHTALEKHVDRFHGPGPCAPTPIARP